MWFAVPVSRCIRLMTLCANRFTVYGSVYDDARTISHPLKAAWWWTFSTYWVKNHFTPLQAAWLRPFHTAWLRCSLTRLDGDSHSLSHDKAWRMRVWTSFQTVVAQNEYSTPWKVLQKRTRSALIRSPKSSFRELRMTKRRFWTAGSQGNS